MIELQNFISALPPHYCKTDVSGSVFRPKNGHELLQALKENKQCEIVDTHAFLAAKVLEDNHCGFSFSFKLSKWNKGWAGFERS